MQRTCAECKFFRIFQEKERLGECLFNPPTAFIMMVPVKTVVGPGQQMAMQRSSYYPLVTFDNQECSKFEEFVPETKSMVSLIHEVKE